MHENKPSYFPKNRSPLPSLIPRASIIFIDYKLESRVGIPLGLEMNVCCISIGTEILSKTSCPCYCIAVFLKKRITWGDKREKCTVVQFSFCHSMLLGVCELLDVCCPCWPVMKETYGYGNVLDCLRVTADLPS
jgi:hypothetical protein